MAKAKLHTLSDGTTIKIRVERGIIGTVFHEVPSRKRKSGALLRMGNRMCLLVKDGKDFVPIRHPDYEYAADDKAGADAALRFFVDSAEATIKHAAEEGIPVEDCY